MLRLHSSTFPGPCTISLAPLVSPWPSILSPGCGWTSHGSSECAPPPPPNYGPPSWSLPGPSHGPSLALLMVPPSVALHYGPSLGLPRGPSLALLGPSLASPHGPSPAPPHGPSPAPPHGPSPAPPHGPSPALHGLSLAPPCPLFSCLSLLLPLLSSSTTCVHCLN
jgi:hypothetical protein